MKNNSKKKSPFVSILCTAICIISLFSSESSVNNAILVPIFVIFLFCYIIAVLKKRVKSSNTEKKNSSSVTSDTPSQHSHDRLSVKNKFTESCQGIEHYKKQLDGFLESGIIDRKEYSVLLDKYTRQLGTKY